MEIPILWKCKGKIEMLSTHISSIGKVATSCPATCFMQPARRRCSVNNFSPTYATWHFAHAGYRIRLRWRCYDISRIWMPASFGAVPVRKAVRAASPYI